MIKETVIKHESGIRRARHLKALVALFTMGIFIAVVPMVGCQQQSAQKPQPTPVEQTSEPSDEKPAKPANVAVHFIDVGQGDSELIVLPDDKVMLIDAGGHSAGQKVVAYLKNQNVSKIDFLVATHPDEDHIGGMTDVLSAFDVGELWMPDASKGTETFISFIDAVERKDLPVWQAYSGKKIGESDAYSLDIIGPAQSLQSKDSNDYSVVVKLTYEANTFLFPGDATAQEIIDDNPGHVDVLKAAHHGSKTGTTTALLQALAPTYVIMSYAEGNSYGHPNQSVLDALSNTSALVYGTGVNGTIVVTSDGTNITVKTSKEGAVVAGVSAIAKARLEQEAAAQAQAEAEQKAQADAAAQAEAATATAAEAATAAAAAQQQQQAQTAQEGETVFITPTGKKYHRSGCQFLRKSNGGTAIDKQQAISEGYTPCSKCRP